MLRNCIKIDPAESGKPEEKDGKRKRKVYNYETIGELASVVMAIRHRNFVRLYFSRARIGILSLALAALKGNFFENNFRIRLWRPVHNCGTTATWWKQRIFGRIGTNYARAFRLRLVASWQRGRIVYFVLVAVNLGLVRCLRQNVVLNCLQLKIVWTLYRGNAARFSVQVARCNKSCADFQKCAPAIALVCIAEKVQTREWLRMHQQFSALYFRKREVPISLTRGACVFLLCSSISSSSGSKSESCLSSSSSFFLNSSSISIYEAYIKQLSFKKWINLGTQNNISKMSPYYI